MKRIIAIFVVATILLCNLYSCSIFLKKVEKTLYFLKDCPIFSFSLLTNKTQRDIILWLEIGSGSICPCSSAGRALDF